MGGLFESLGRLADEVLELVKADVPPEEIRKRLTDPGGVLDDVIANVKKRKDKFDDFVRNG